MPGRITQIAHWPGVLPASTTQLWSGSHSGWLRCLGTCSACCKLTEAYNTLLPDLPLSAPPSFPHPCPSSLAPPCNNTNHALCVHVSAHRQMGTGTGSLKLYCCSLQGVVCQGSWKEASGLWACPPFLPSPHCCSCPVGPVLQHIKLQLNAI